MAMIYTSEELKREIWNTYNRDPLDWKMLIGRDDMNFYELLVIHRDTYWLLKEEQINPFKTVGVGVKGRTKQDIVRSLPKHDFGLRPIPKDKIFAVLNLLRSGYSINTIVEKLLSLPPMPVHEIKSPLAVYGPVFVSKEPIDFISSRHKKLREKLQIELEKLLNKKYPHILSAYG